MQSVAEAEERVGGVEGDVAAAADDGGHRRREVERQPARAPERRRAARRRRRRRGHRTRPAGRRRRRRSRARRRAGRRKRTTMVGTCGRCAGCRSRSASGNSSDPAWKNASKPPGRGSNGALSRSTARSASAGSSTTRPSRAAALGGDVLDVDGRSPAASGQRGRAGARLRSAGRSRRAARPRRRRRSRPGRWWRPRASTSRKGWSNRPSTNFSRSSRRTETVDPRLADPARRGPARRPARAGTRRRTGRSRRR